MNKQMIKFTEVTSLKKLYSKDTVSFRGNFIKTYANRKYSIRDFLIRYIIEPIQEKSVLDIGPGNGSFLERLESLYPKNQYYALDIVRANDFSENHRIQFRCYDGMRFPFVSGEKYDLIFCMHMLYHVADLNCFFTEIKKILKTDGRLIVTTKSIHTFHHIEKIFMEIVDEMNVKGIPRERDEKVFCRENAESIIWDNFDNKNYNLNIYDLSTQMIIDDIDNLYQYIFSTMRYDLIDLLSDADYQKYKQLWKEKLSGERIFIDEVLECVLVLNPKKR